MGAKSHLDFGDTSPENSLMHSALVAVKPDFSGWATKANVKCGDGRTILPNAFAHQDKAQVPLVWQHGHDDPGNVLGHAILENRGEDGVYAYGYFNETENAKAAKAAVEHTDINALSIFANKLVEKAKAVSHGIIREISLVMAGANPGALIDNIELKHSDGEMVTLDDEAVIYSGETLAHGDATGEPGKPPEPTKDDGPTVQDVFDKMTDEQKEVVHYFVGAAIDSNASAPDDTTIAHKATDPDDKETRTMNRNVFEKENPGKPGEKEKHTLSHDAMMEIYGHAKRTGSFKEGLGQYALAHGIDDIEILFPDARTVTDTPEFDKRRTEWVSAVINGTKHAPFSRIKSVTADITHDEARARGYIKGTLKKEEFFGLVKRITTPSTFYKKQSLDRDDIIDITDFDVVAWLWGEMRLMLDEELARAIMIGDGREVDDEDKIRDPSGSNEGAGIRSILHDNDLYAATVNVNLDDANSNYTEVVEQVMLNMELYKGSGSPTFYTTLGTLTRMLLTKDTLGRRLWRSASELATEMGVANIVTVEVFDQEPDLVGIIVNLNDYTVGTDRGGEISRFDDFDIDYNQYKYLLEGRCSGALTKIRAALIIKKVAGSDVLKDPQDPTFDPATGDIVVPNQVGVSYRRADTDAVVSNTTITLADGESLTVYAVPTAGNYFATNVDDQWTFTKRA